MSDEQYRNAKENNSRALTKAREDLISKPRKIAVEEYAASNPKFGYQRLPWLDTGQNSLYAERSIAGFLRFQSKEAEAEYHQVDAAVAQLFRLYDSK